MMLRRDLNLIHELRELNNKDNWEKPGDFPSNGINSDCVISMFLYILDARIDKSNLNYVANFQQPKWNIQLCG